MIRVRFISAWGIYFAGDVAACYADPTRARDLMGWQSQFDLDRMCQDAWRWQQANPDGYN